MATLDAMKAPLITAAVVTAKGTTTKMEAAIWKARKPLLYYGGAHLSAKDRYKLADDIAEYLATAEPQNANAATINSAMLLAGHQSSEYVVSKILDELITAGLAYIAARKAEDGGNE